MLVATSAAMTPTMCDLRTLGLDRESPKQRKSNGTWCRHTQRSHIISARVMRITDLWLGSKATTPKLDGTSELRSQVGTYVIDAKVLQTREVQESEHHRTLSERKRLLLCTARQRQGQRKPSTPRNAKGPPHEESTTHPVRIDLVLANTSGNGQQYSELTRTSLRSRDFDAAQHPSGMLGCRWSPWLGGRPAESLSASATHGHGRAHASEQSPKFPNQQTGGSFCDDMTPSAHPNTSS